MKVFNNLRAILTRHKENMPVVVLAEMLAEIDEAEAKWESECCEWAPMKFLEFSLSDCVTSCGHAEHYSTGIDKYCRHCGKPIKISEVE